MKHNVGATDRNVRAVGGAVLAAVGVAILGGALEFGTAVGAVALLIGGVLVGTALTRTCLLYRILGVDTSS
ncbi:hypothetical protein A6E15_06055 [Natrinema saccharevitans]|uniref:Inner membrane protein YgaP-like transmembrane domain-containing protein n=1 Tax=Natrinema saccharevitans TaxID=301967 RepID=A0A1S8AV44_9EURY|nr:DUF2892 domain-containing protein [Natrinema saccharevitans]OLZ40580.1 hypothetical protein A6E15_06055 [Natrinema saccharevitans]